MKKAFLIVGMLVGAIVLVNAQDATQESSSGDYAPAAGDFSGAILFGRGNFLNGGLDVPIAANYASYWNWSNTPIPGTSPYANNIDPNENSITNIVGGEVRYFVMDNIAAKLSGGAIIRNTPSRPNIPGFTPNDTDPTAWIPAYAAVEADNRVDVNVNVGGEYHFSTKYDRLFPYAGVTIPFYYARRSMYNPTIETPTDSDGTPTGDAEIVDIGVRSVQIIGFGGQAVAGVDYYLMEGLYFGFEIKPLSYIYAYSDKIPAPGLESLQADTHTWSFFSQPFFKVGFRF